jgi:hypothetical protein
MMVFCFSGCKTTDRIDASFSLTIDEDPQYSDSQGRARPRITLANSCFIAVIATKKGATCGIETGILQYIQKSTGTDQARSIIDANYMRGPVITADVTDDTNALKRVVLTYEDLPDVGDREEETDNSAKVAYTIFPFSPVLKIEYLERLPEPDPIVDLGAPGGAERTGNGFSDNAKTRVYGQEKFNELVCHPATYWTSVSDDPRLTWSPGPDDGGPLSYKGHLIVAVGSIDNREGYGRVVPVHRAGTAGGARHLKLLWNTGIEFYAKPWTDREYGHSKELQAFSPPFTAYLFCFDDGLENAIQMGKKITDGNMLAVR